MALLCFLGSEIMKNVVQLIKSAIENKDYTKISDILSNVNCKDDIKNISANKIFYKLLSKNLLDNSLTEVYINSVRNVDPSSVENEYGKILFSRNLFMLNEAISELLKEHLILECKGSLKLFFFLQEQYVILRNKKISAKSFTSISDWHEIGGCFRDYSYFDTLLLDIAFQCLNFDLYDEKKYHTPYIDRNSSPLNNSYINISLWRFTYGIFDKLSFDEYKISKIELENDKFTFSFDYTDPSLILSKYAGIRTSLITSNRAIEEDFQEMIRFIEVDISNFGKKKYRLSHKQTLKIIHELRELVRFNYVETFMILLSKQMQGLLYLLLYIAMFFKLESEYIKKNKLKIAYTIIVIDDLKRYLIEAGILLENEFDKLISKIGVYYRNNKHSNYGTLISCPILRNGNILLHPQYLPLFPNGIYQTLTYIIPHNGEQANAYGSMFNDFIAEVSLNNNWKILNKDFKVKHNKQTITDIDLILLKDDLLVYIQSKCTIKTVDIYAHYKAKERIIEGINQAKLSLEYDDLIKNRNGINDNEKIHTYAIVITNNNCFTGWKNNDKIPVMSLERWVWIMNNYVKNSFEFEIFSESYLCPHKKDLKMSIKNKDIFGLFNIEYEDIY